MWQCKKCGGKIRTLVTRSVSEVYNIEEDGFPIGKCLQRIKGEQVITSYYCSKCEYIYDPDSDIKDIAKLVK